MPRARASCLLALALAAGHAGAADPGPGPDLVTRLHGVYRHRFTSGDVHGGVSTAENILEIVPYGPGTAYVRVHLDFFNGHSCKLFGIARAAGDALEYRRPGLPGRVTIRLTGKRVELGTEEGYDGSGACGVRGSLSAAWPASARRTIRYLERLRASWEYRRAVEEHERAGGPGPTR